jgi:hypothetical protein
MNGSQRKPADPRRQLVMIVTIVLLLVSGALSMQFGQTGSARFVATATGRVGLLMAALWLAWPSLRRPASWLPPGFAFLGVIVLAVLAAQPRLIVVAIPAFGTLLALATVLRSFKRR